jgi:hypothetical protein
MVFLYLADVFASRRRCFSFRFILIRLHSSGR